MATVSQRRKYAYPSRIAAEEAAHREEANGSRFRQFMAGMLDNRVTWFRASTYDIGVLLQRWNDPVCCVVHHPEGQKPFPSIYPMLDLIEFRRSLWQTSGDDASQLRGLMDDAIGQFNGRFTDED